MKINLNIFTLFVAFLSLGSCKQNQEKPGGYQGANQVDSKKDKKNGEIDDLVADYESHDRLIWQKPDMVINRLGDLSREEKKYVEREGERKSDCTKSAQKGGSLRVRLRLTLRLEKGKKRSIRDDIIGRKRRVD